MTPLVGELAFFIADELQPKYRSVAFATLCQSVARNLESLGIDEPPVSPFHRMDQTRIPVMRTADGKIVSLVPDFFEVLRTINEMAKRKDVGHVMQPAVEAVGRMIEREIEGERLRDESGY